MRGIATFSTSAGMQKSCPIKPLAAAQHTCSGVPSVAPAPGSAMFGVRDVRNRQCGVARCATFLVLHVLRVERLRFSRATFLTALFRLLGEEPASRPKPPTPVPARFCILQR